MTPPSRIHPIALQADAKCRFWLLRDDEQGFAVSGTKLRKYASLIPAFQSQGIQKALVLGGLNSNNLVGLAQHLRAAGIAPVPMLPVSKGENKGFNTFLLRLLVAESQWIQVPRSEWKDAESLAAAWVEDQKAQHVKAAWIPEGCFCKEALPGAMRLAEEISAAPNPAFSHVFMEAGTGLSAIALLLGLRRQAHKPQVHVVLLADKPLRFLEKLRTAADWLGLAGSNIPQESTDFKLHVPSNAASFGSVNATVLRELVALARGHGLLCDPIYSAKLFYESKRIVQVEGIQGDVLLVHAGGANGLPGFQAMLEPYLG